MNKIIRSLSIFALSISSLCAYAQIAVPEVTVLGKKYYCYEAKKGDSLYGISKELGWDQNLITSLNPELSSPFKEGQLIYYPVSESDTVPSNNTTVSHKVKKGETVYGISKHYNISTEQIYSANPGSEFGIKEGQILTIRTSGGSANGFVTHTIQPGETLYGVSKHYNTSVEELMHDNPRINDHNFKAGEVIKVTPNSRNKNLVKESVAETHLLSLKTYKVKKNDTWEKLSKKFKVDVPLLQDANPGVSHLDKDKQIVIPNAVVVNVMKDVPVTDPRESTPEGRQEIFEDVQEILAEEAKSKDVRIAIVLADPSSNKDMEFTRGFIKAIDDLKNSPYKISLKVEEEQAADLITQLNKFSPTIIVTTTEKDLPTSLTDYVSDHDCILVNSFDVKSTTYETVKNIVHILPPSNLFNAKITNFVKNRFGDRNLIILGEPDNKDTMAESVMSAMDASRVISVPVKEIQDFVADADSNYLIYLTDTKKADVKAALEGIKSLREKSFNNDFAVLGRANLITLASSLNDLFCENGVYFPSRFYFDSELSASRKFIDEYKELYTHTPIKSFPVYAITGYDIAEFFIPAMNETAGNLDNISNANHISGLQNDFNLVHDSNSLGFVNDVVYMIKFNTFGNIDKINIE